MKAVQILLLAVIVACASAFSPVKTSTPALKSLSVNKLSEPVPVTQRNDKNAAAAAAFATAMAPFAAHAENTVVDEATIIGYGAGLVACVVSLAVGFAIGYGTLVKP
jgi:hypothetical protein